MATTILAGDVGATKADLSLFRILADGELRPIREARLATSEFGGLPELVLRFLETEPSVPGVAVLGVPGPVWGDEIRLPNLPWTIDRDRLIRSTGIPNVKLLNDLEAMAHGTLAIPAEHTAALNVGVGRPGHRAVIAAGTGLGQAFLYWDGSVHHPVATEGGHASFAPRDGEQVELLEFLRCRHDHVSWERVLSGPGLEAIFDFLGESRGLRAREPVISRIDAGESVAAVVGEAGVTGACDTCRRAVDLFLQLYGMQAANLALTVFALGGVYVGGGIIRKLLPRALEGPFREGFLDVGRLRKLLETIPVRAIREPRTAVTGAARVAIAAVRSGR